MAGRDQILKSMMKALDRSGRAPELNTLIYGPRGTGKTALLALIAEESQAHGWISVSASCYPGMLEDIYEQAIVNGREFLRAHGTTHLTGVSVGSLFSVEWQRDPEVRGNWRTRMTHVLEELGGRGVGLLITVDEVDPKLEEMILLASVYQLFVRERRRVGLLMAGLPGNISSLVQNKSVSFLRRAKRQQLGRIPDDEIALAFGRTLQDGGKAIGADALQEVVRAIDGFPFMLQLVGYYVWESSPAGDDIDLETARCGIAIARGEMRQVVLEPTYLSLSEGDLAFCRTMLADQGDSRIADIVDRLGKSPSTINTYRSRLIKQGIISSPRRGVVAFELPLFREYLEDRD